MERRESLGLSIDGEAMTISGEGSHRNRDVGSKVSETAIYLVEPELICRIAAAASVAVRIYGAMLPT